MLRATAGNGLKRHDDQGVAHQYGRRLIEGSMHGRATATDRGVVETRQIVMCQRGAVHQLNRYAGGSGQRRIAIAVGMGDLGQQQRAKARAAGKHSVAHRLEQAWRPRRTADAVEVFAKRPLDAAPMTTHRPNLTHRTNLVNTLDKLLTMVPTVCKVTR